MVAATKLHRSINRRRAGRFLVEGPNLVDSALRHGVVREVYATESALERFGGLLSGCDVAVVTDRAAKALSDTVTPVGLVAVCDTVEHSLSELLSAAPQFVVVAVGIGEPGNAGTLIRTANAMGADAVIFTGDAVDPYNSKCLRASAGSFFAVPVTVAPEPADVVAAIRAGGLQVLATTPDGDVDLDDADLATPTAWLFGAEAHGLPAEVAAAATRRVRIPMRGGAESLNVAAAAAICLYQSSRALRSL